MRIKKIVKNNYPVWIVIAVGLFLNAKFLWNYSIVHAVTLSLIAVILHLLTTLCIAWFSKRKIDQLRIKTRV
jgi:Kef-type K+ transport system membrane component KefB